MKFRMHALALPVAGFLALGAVPAEAQGWTVDRDEYACKSASLANAAVLTELTPAGDTYSIRVTFPIPGDSPRDAPHAAGGAYTIRPLNGPAFTSSLIEVEWDGSRSTAERYAYKVRVHLSVDATTLTQIAAANPGVELVGPSGRVTTFPLAGLTQARAALAACTPVAPPPNRALAAPDNVRGWAASSQDLQDYMDLARGLDVTTPFAANLTVNGRGRVETCVITASTGFVAVDKRICSNLTRRGRFTAATDAAGKHITATYTYQLPVMRFNRDQ